MNMKIVYVVTEREGRSYWSRIGTAFTNRDGSLSVKLEALPLRGEMQIRDVERVPSVVKTTGYEVG